MDVLGTLSEIKPSLRNLFKKTDHLDVDIYNVCKTNDIGGTIVLFDGLQEFLDSSQPFQRGEYYKNILDYFGLLNDDFNSFFEKYNNSIFNMSSGPSEMSSIDDKIIHKKIYDCFRNNIVEVSLYNQIESDIELDDIENNKNLTVFITELEYNEYLPLRIIKNFKDGKATISYWENDPDEIDRKMTQYLEWTMEQNQGDLDPEDFGISTTGATYIPISGGGGGSCSGCTYWQAGSCIGYCYSYT